MSIKGYKVFKPDWTCRGFQYKVGETFKHNGNIKMCGLGFHFCQAISDCFSYYNFDSNNKVAEVEAIGLVETQGNKSVTDEIRIIREITWQEVLNIVNTGRDCTGLCNSGNFNSGNRNSGGCNSGNRNSGNRNSGGCNSGNRNSGDFNSGNFNSGNFNSGGCNSGNFNSGNRNSGGCNSGNRNSGDCNSGNFNSGNRNSGNRNSGDCNSGNFNSGNFNSGNYNSGFFNFITPKLMMFEKPTDLTYDEVQRLRGIQVLNRNFEKTWWIYSENMTEEEKKVHPEHEAAGGYLKTVSYKEACRIMWDKLTDCEKKEVKGLPNFDSKIFKKITGIEL